MAERTPSPLPLAWLGALGRPVVRAPALLVRLFGMTGALTNLAGASLYCATIGPFTGRGRIRKQLFPMMTNVGVRSLPIVSLVAVLTGAILVLQTGHTIEKFGQIQEVPGLVALSMTRALGPLMTAIVLISRVGASFTAVLGSMTINDEVVALRTMSIDPVSYLVAPRIVSIVVMTPALVVFSYLLGMVGGGVVASSVYDIGPHLYVQKTYAYLGLGDLLGGLLKAVVFGFLIGVVSCHFGLNTSGGPTGLGRNIMVSVVTSLVIIVFADAALTGLLVNYVLTQ